MEHKTVCLPYSKTGYCKYGDTCKYSHIRITEKEDSERCSKCLNKPVSPTVTLCKHVYCYECIVDVCLENDKCYICNDVLNGIFYNK